MELNLAKKEEKQKSLALAVFGIASAILLFRLIASFFPQERLWGFNHAGYLAGLPVIYPALFLCTLSFYLWGKKKPQIFPIPDDTGQPASLLRRISPILIILLALSLFYFLAVDSHFLGDGYQMLSNMNQTHPTLKGRADGEMRIQLLYYELFSLGDKFDGYRTFRNLSILAGLIFISGLLYYGRKIFASRFAYYSFVALNFLSAITILYYGYVEAYSLTTAASFIFFLSGTAALKNNSRSIMPIAAFGAAVFLHRVNIIYSPSLLIYIIYFIGPMKIKNWVASRGKQLIYLAGACFILMYIAIKLWAPQFWQMAFLPIFADRFTLDEYTLFSAKHIVDYVNLLFLVVPVAILAWVMPRILKEEKRNEPTSYENIFLWLAILSGGLSAFILEPKLGMARDWDLMSTMLVGIQVAGVYFWVKRYYVNIRFQAATAIVAVICLSVFIPWLGLNYSRVGLYRYNMAMMELDPKHARAGFYAVGEMMQNAGGKGEVERILQYCYRHFPEVGLDKEGARNFRDGQLSKALDLFNRAIDANPAWFGPYLDKGICLVAMKRPKEAIEALETADGLNPYSPPVYRSLGDAYNLLGDKERAVAWWEKSLYYGPSEYQTFMALGQYCLQNNMPDSAIYYYTALPDSVYPREVLYQLGVAEMTKGDTLRASSYFDKYIAVGKDSTVIQNIVKLKSQF